MRWLFGNTVKIKNGTRQIIVVIGSTTFIAHHYMTFKHHFSSNTRNAPKRSKGWMGFIR